MVQKPKQRDSTQIMYELLKAMKGGGLHKTRLMGMVYLSFTQINEYLTSMDMLQLIRKEPDSKIYLSEKGQAFMQKYEHLMELFDVRTMGVPEKDY